MDYCDINMFTAFVNKFRLNKTLGGYGSSKFKDAINAKFPIAEEKSKRVTKCFIARDPLIHDIGKHGPSLGAVLTYAGLKEIEVVDVNGLKKGRELYNKACSRVPKESGFYGKFCKDSKLKNNNEIAHNELNDIRHFGSAVEMGADRFITMNKKDFKPVKIYTKIKLE